MLCLGFMTTDEPQSMHAKSCDEQQREEAANQPQLHKELTKTPWHLQGFDVYWARSFRLVGEWINNFMNITSLRDTPLAKWGLMSSHCM